MIVITKIAAKRMFEKLLLRQVESPSPEHKLIVAIIGKAFDDAMHPKKGHEARQFFIDGRMTEMAELAGIAPESVTCFARGLSERLPAKYARIAAQ